MPFSTLLLAIEPLNLLIDFALVILAMAMIRSLQMKTQAKWKLRFLLGLGGLSVTAYIPFTAWLTHCRAGVFGFLEVGLAYSPGQECE